MKMMDSFNLRKGFDIFTLLFVCIGTMFYIPVARHIAFDSAINWGYFTQEMFFRYGAFCVIAFSALLKPLRSLKLGGLFAILAVLLAISLLNGFDVHSRRNLINLFTAFFFIKAVGENVSDAIYIRAAYAFAIVLVLNLVMCVFQFFGKDPLLTPDPNLGRMDKLAGFMRQKVHLGILAAMFSPILFSLTPIFLLISIPCVILSKSSAAIVSLVIGTLILIRQRYDRSIFRLAILSLGFSAFFYIWKYDMPGGQFAQRFEVWFQTLSYTLKSNVILGNGLGSFGLWLPTTTQLTSPEPLLWNWAHNEYLQMFFEGGLVTLSMILCYVTGFLNKIKNALACRRFATAYAGLFIVAAVSFLHFPFHIGRLAIPAVFLIALFEKERAYVN